MAHGNGFASLSRMARKGATPTEGAPGAVSTDMAAPMSIGAVEDDVPVVPERPPVRRSAFAAVSRKTMPASEEPVARDYTGGTTGFASLQSDETKAKAVRRDVHAVKLLTRLAQAIAFKPGTAAPGKVKAEALRDLLLKVHRMAGRIAQAAMPEEANARWVHAHCSEQVAELVARRIEAGPAGEHADVDQTVDAACQVIRSAAVDQEVAAAVDAVEQNRYVESTHEQITRDRLTVSITLATGDVYDAVAKHGWSYGRAPIAITEQLTQGLLAAAREVSIHQMDVDQQVTHLQGSVRRMANLVAAEYSAETLRLKEWIEASADERQRQERMAGAGQAFDEEVLPTVLANAKSTLTLIERSAPRMLDVTFQDFKNQDRPHGN